MQNEEEFDFFRCFKEIIYDELESFYIKDIFKPVKRYKSKGFIGHFHSAKFRLFLGKLKWIQQCIMFGVNFYSFVFF